MTPTSRLADELRNAISKLRTTSTPLADLIPLLQQAADALDSRAAESVEQWVPVTERLPDHDGYYEVTSSEPYSPRVYVLELRDAEWPGHAHWRVNGDFMGYVIAWRPTREPYVARQAEKENS